MKNLYQKSHVNVVFCYGTKNPGRAEVTSRMFLEWRERTVKQ